MVRHDAREEAYRAAAKKMLHAKLGGGDEYGVADDALVSLCDDAVGAWVTASVFVPADLAGEGDDE